MRLKICIWIFATIIFLSLVSSGLEIPELTEKITLLGIINEDQKPNQYLTCSFSEITLTQGSFSLEGITKIIESECYYRFSEEQNEFSDGDATLSFDGYTETITIDKNSLLQEIDISLDLPDSYYENIIQEIIPNPIEDEEDPEIIPDVPEEEQEEDLFDQRLQDLLEKKQKETDNQIFNNPVLNPSQEEKTIETYSVSTTNTLNPQTEILTEENTESVNDSDDKNDDEENDSSDEEDKSSKTTDYQEELVEFTPADNTKSSFSSQEQIVTKNTPSQIKTNSKIPTIRFVDTKKTNIKEKFTFVKAHEFLIFSIMGTILAFHLGILMGLRYINKH